MYMYMYIHMCIYIYIYIIRMFRGLLRAPSITTCMSRFSLMYIYIYIYVHTHIYTSLKYCIVFGLMDCIVLMYTKTMLL